MMPVLPLETLEEIMGHLHNDTTTLATCSLASRVLLPSTRHHLFSEVILRVYSMDILLDILDAPWSSIAPVIRDLVVAGRGRPTSAISAFTVEAAYLTTGSEVSSGMQRIIDNLQNVQCIRLQCILWDQPACEVATMLCSLRGVKELQFYWTSFPSVNNFTRYICSYPALQVLSSSRTNIQKTSSPEVDCSRLMIRVAHLDLQYTRTRDPRHLLEWLLSLKVVPPVHTLSIDQESQSLLLSQFVRKTGSSIQRLDIKFIDGNIPGALIDFSPLRNLHILCISGLRADNELEVGGLMKVIVSQISSTRITELSLQLVLSSIPWKNRHFLVENYGWSGIPQLLLQPLFADIQKLSITLSQFTSHYNWDSELMMRLVRRGPFSIFDDRGILEVHFVPDPPRTKATAGRARRRVVK